MAGRGRVLHRVCVRARANTEFRTNFPQKTGSKVSHQTGVVSLGGGKGTQRRKDIVCMKRLLVAEVSFDRSKLFK